MKISEISLTSKISPFQMALSAHQRRALGAFETRSTCKSVRPLAKPVGARVVRGGSGATPTTPSRRVPAAPRAAGDAGRFIPRWSTCFEALRSKGLETVSAEEAARLVQSGEWVLVDVRRGDQFAVASPQGAVSVPLYDKLVLGGAGGFDAGKLLKSVAYAFNGVDPIDPNPNFGEQVDKLTEGGRKGLIFACEAGGTMRPSVNFPEGKASRSLQACYKAMEERGVSRVKHLERGLFGWYQADLPFTGDYTPEIGRFPSAAGEPVVPK